ncbi:MAG: hypothetical protein AVDCRST_MAG11-892, partial [uncultured Gemmatimonadaceae bacterium]
TPTATSSRGSPTGPSEARTGSSRSDSAEASRSRLRSGSGRSTRATPSSSWSTSRRGRSPSCRSPPPSRRRPARRRPCCRRWASWKTTPTPWSATLSSSRGSTPGSSASTTWASRGCPTARRTSR